MERNTNKEFAQEAIDKALMLCCETENIYQEKLQLPSSPHSQHQDAGSLYRLRERLATLPEAPCRQRKW